jgi:membrane-associated phospholipid phosphatase
METLAEIILHSNNTFAYATYIIIGLALPFLRRAVLIGTCLLLISIGINKVLKSLFAVPLLPTVPHDGFAFPSGHTQSLTVFWGWLLLNFFSPYRLVYALMFLSANAWAMVLKGYHTPFDIMGGLVAGTALIFAARYLLQRYNVT